MLLDRIIERELESFRARNRGRVIELVGLRPDLDNQAIVEADETLLGLLLENLLGNAVKYSSPADAIEVAIDVVGDAVEVRILDRGIGFDEGVSERLFEPFYRSERARGAANGLGIGLALCRRIVDELGGRIWALPRDGGGAVWRSPCRSRGRRLAERGPVGWIGSAARRPAARLRRVDSEARPNRNGSARRCR